MQRLYKFLRSMKLAVTLILVILGTSLLSTLIPQGQEPMFYYGRYGQVLGWLIVSTQFHVFFKSVIFLLPSALLFLSLCICTYDRFYKRLKAKAKPRYGPDLIHVGILVLIIGGVITFVGRIDGTIYMGEGDFFQLPGGYEIELLSYRFFQYEDGRPKDWISTVRVSKDGILLTESYSIEVNRPLEAGPWRVFQANYSKEDVAFLKGSDGEERRVSTRRAFQVGERIFLFLGVEGALAGTASGTAVFEEWENHEPVALYRAAVGEKFDIYTVESLSRRDLTGLKAVVDPGYIPAFIGMILIGVGLSLFVVQKIGDKEL